MNVFVRKLLLAPFFLAVLAIDAAGIAIRRFSQAQRRHRSKPSYDLGISVVIPERANKEMLRQCLQSVQEARSFVLEPVQVVVVVTDAKSDMYRDLTLEFEADWIFRSEPLWFADAVALGLRAAKHDWVYLLNTDMVVAPNALAAVAKWRGPSVFAVASQIHFQDPGRRREETGLTELRNACGLLEISDVIPRDDRIRRHAYAGGGSSLFRRDLLGSFIERARGYAPFYWEDVEWGVLAWRNGFEVLFCPQSEVWHAHRSTNLKFFSHDEIERIFKRNRLQFQLNTGLAPGSLRTVFSLIAKLDTASFREMLTTSRFVDTVRSRIESYFEAPYRLDQFCPSTVYYSRQRRPGVPLVLLASPYVVYPPAHGGAKRIHELIARLAKDVDVILLSDERENYSQNSFNYFKNCYLVCLTGGRKADPDRDGRIDRILSHSHATLVSELRELIRIHDPDIVQIEYVELAKLVELRDNRPWILTLHDVLLKDAATGAPASTSKEDVFELQYIERFDAVMVCSGEDRALLRHDNVHIVHNGANISSGYVPSAADGPILFLGPFRYAPNLKGILHFLRCVYPAIRGDVQDAQLWILGGSDARVIAARDSCFALPGVEVFDFIEDVQPYLQRCSISINPDREVRGSSLKVIESLAAGRICVSTLDGARGLVSANLPSLRIVEEDQFAREIVRLLVDIEYRHRMEVPTEALNQFSWQRTSEDQMRIYKSLLRTGCSTRTRASEQAHTLAG